jgi:ribosomal protein L34E
VAVAWRRTGGRSPSDREKVHPERKKEMRIRATCHACDRDFLFFELRNVGSGVADRCPNCDRPLGVQGLRAVRAEQAMAILVGALDDLADHHPEFTVHADSVLRPIENALTPLALPPAPEVEEHRPRRRWRRVRAAV